MYRSSAVSNFVYSRHHYLYTAAELASAGITSGSLISNLQWNLDNAAASNSPFTFQIWIKNSSATTVGAAGQAWATLISGSTQVYNNSATTVSGPNWQVFSLSPFTYTGGALEISVNFDISGGASPWTSAGFSWKKDNSTNTTLSYVGATAPPATLPNLRTVRPQIRITYGSGSVCTAPPTAGTATATPSSGICVGTTISLGLTGNSTGTGQTYQWQSGPSASGPWTNIGASSASPSLNIVAGVTEYYQCEVTCSGNSQVSTPVLVTVNPPFPGGTYTIDKTQPASATNFVSFASAISALSCGIAGPVIFDVVSGTGPYNEQVLIPGTINTSAVNTVTFNGNNNTLTVPANTTNLYTLGLNGADYFTFNDLVIEGTDATSALACHLWNNADNNSFNNCTFSVSITATATTTCPFSISGSATAVASSGASGSNNVLTGCTAIGGHYSIVCYGNSAAANTGNKILNCIARDFNSYGIYSLYQSGWEVAGCTVERVNRSTFTTTYCIYASTGSVSPIVRNNRVRNIHGANASATTATYCIYIGTDGTPGNEAQVYNNLIYKNASNGTIAGLYLSGADYIKAYHNTISLDDASSTATVVTYGIYSTGSVGGIDIKNNIVTITRGGTGTKYGLFYTNNFQTSDNNDIYINAAAGTNYFGSNAAATYLTLALWQGTVAKDLASSDANPSYNNISLDDYTPTSSTINNMGTGVGIATDIFGNPRSVSSPDPGCIEYNLSSVDMSIVSVTSPNLSGCYSGSEQVTVTIQNAGSDPIDFSLNPVTVTVNFNGPASYTASETLNFGTLGVGASQSLNLNPPVDLTVDGVYNVTGNISTSGDGNPANDNIIPFNINVGIIPGTITSSLPLPLCVTNPTTFTLTGQYGGAKQWQLSTVSASGPWTNVGTGTNTYAPGVINSDYWVQVESTCNSNIAVSNVLAVGVNNPSIATTIPGSHCGIGTVTLDAQPTFPSDSIKWYTTPSGGTPIFTGTSFVTPTLSATTTYYAAAVSAGIGNVTTGLPAALSTFTSGSGTTNYGIVFDVIAPCILQSVKIYPVHATAGTPGSVTIDVINGSGTVLHTLTVPVIGNPVATAYLNPQTVNLNFNLTPGTNYKIRPGTITGVTGLLFGPSAAAPGGNWGYPMTVSGYLTINHSTLTAAPTNTANLGLYYYFCDWQIVAGCSGPRIPVVATITTAPSITVTSLNPAVCPGGSTDVSVSSVNDPDYTYTWSSTPSGFVNTGSGPFTVSPTTTTTYEVIAEDLTAGPNAGCVAIGSVQVITAPVLSGGTVTSSESNLCVTGSSTLTLTGASGGPIQWQESSVSASGPWTNVGAGANTYNTGTITQTMHYQVEVSCGASTVYSNPVTVTVNNPSLTSTQGDTRCGTGIVNLSAVPNAGTVNWYANASGGAPLATNNNYSPTVSATTTFYAAATDGGSSGFMGLPNRVGATTNSGYSDVGLMFNATVPFTLNSVAIYPVATTPSGNVTATIALKNSAGTILQSTTISVPTSVSPGVKTVVPLNFAVPAGTGHRLVFTSATGGGISGFIREATTGFTYPYTYPGVASITSAYTGGASSIYYYYFYDWSITNGCEGTRVPVLATVNPAPAITVSTIAPICIGETATLNVSSSNDPDYTYTWMPGNLVGANHTVSPTATTVYTVTATDNTAGPNSGCADVQTVTVTVNNVQVTLTSVSATPAALCEGGNVSLASVTAAPGYVLNGACTTGFIDISGTGVDIPGVLADDSEHNISMPSFTFNGITYTNARVGVNGVIVLGSTALEVSLTNAALPSTANTAGNIFLAPWWDDLDIQTGLTIKTQTVGNTFIIQYTNAAHNSFTTGGVTFQAQLDLVTGVITYVYSDVTFGNVLYDAGVSATVGIQMSSTSALQYSFNTASLTTGQCISFTPNTATVSWVGPNGFTSSLNNPTLTSVTTANAGTYTVTASGNNGCGTSATVAVVVNTATSTSTTVNNPCGTPYLWSVNNVTYNTSGTYINTTTNGSGCLQTDTLILTIPQCSATLNLKCFIQGYYVSDPFDPFYTYQTMRPAVFNQIGSPYTATDCDTLTVELHDATFPYALATGIPAFVGVMNTNGLLTCTFPGTAVGGSYYIAVKHRNALQTWSANPVTIAAVNSYDFTNLSAPGPDTVSYGPNQYEVEPGIWAFISGDITDDGSSDNQDGAVDGFDYTKLDPLVINGDCGYYGADLNGDGCVDAFDYIILDPNIIIGYTINIPQ